MRTWASLVVAALALSAVQGCGPVACSDVGGTTGISLAVPEALFVASGQVRFEVCDEKGCARTTYPLRKVPKASAPERRWAYASFEGLGRTFGPGPVEVTAQLRGPRGRVAAERRERIRLRASYPNGKACDGDGFVGGRLALRPSDAV